MIASLICFDPTLIVTLFSSRFHWTVPPMAVMIALVGTTVRSLIMDKVQKLTDRTPQSQTFNDVDPSDWFLQVVEMAAHAGIVEG